MQVLKKFVFIGIFLFTIVLTGASGRAHAQICNDPRTTEQKITASDGRAYYRFGYAVGVDGDYAIVGSPWHAWTSDKGAAYILTRVGGSWVQTNLLLANDRQLYDTFGVSVGISGNFAIVGSFLSDPKGLSSGSAYIFQRSGSQWNQTKVTALDGAAGDYFGESVAISGNFAVVGAPNDDDRGQDSGSAYIFEYTGSSWHQVAKIYASDGQAGDGFGRAVAMDSTRIVIGAYLDDDNGQSSGSAYVFERSGSSWNQVAKLKASDGAASDFFGETVSISGDDVLVGAYGNDDAGDRSGSAYIFSRSGGAWPQAAKLAPSDPKSMRYFGNSVSIDGDYALIGGHWADNGTAYLFERSGGSWTQRYKLAARDGQVSDGFGISVAISGSNLIVGSYGDDDKGDYTGSAYLYSTCLIQDACLNDPNKTEPGICGCGVADVDTDGDGTLDCLDGCKYDRTKTSPGICGCNAPDTDSDGDGVFDCIDGCPANPAKTGPGVCGCSAADTDSDGDGTADCQDGCPYNPVKTSPGICGCNTADIDSDNDGTMDCQDGCPYDRVKTSPGICGCGRSDVDSDGDGVADCFDGCIDDPNKNLPGVCGCGVADVDTDGDGAKDCVDACVNDPGKTEAGICGCGVADTDTDGDGTADCNDGCKDDPFKTDHGACGCGIADTDSDGDSIPDCMDPNNMVDNLIDIIVNALDLPGNVENSYLANLKKISDFIDAGNVIPAINQVNAFISKVEEDMAHEEIPAADGSYLILLAQNLLNQIHI